MILNIYQKLIQQCDIFTSELKTSPLLKEYSHLIADINKYSKSIANETRNGSNPNIGSSSIDFSWHENLKTFISNTSLPDNSKIKSSANYINEATQTLIKYNDASRQVRASSSGISLSENKEYLFTLVDIKNQPLTSTIEYLESENSKISEEISRITDLQKLHIDSSIDVEKTIENNFSKIKLDLLESEKDLNKSIEERVNNLFNEKINKIEEIYQKTLTLNSEVAGKIISNDFSKSAKREKFWADTLRTLCFVVLLACAFLLYQKGESFTLPNPSSISPNDYINLLKTSAISIFLISLSILSLKEASKHRSQQYFYENQALKIMSLGPLISDIEKEKQESVKQEVAKFIFSAEHKINVTDDSSSAFLGMTKILEKLIDKK